MLDLGEDKREAVTRVAPYSKRSSCKESEIRFQRLTHQQF